MKTDGGGGNVSVVNHISGETGRFSMVEGRPGALFGFSLTKITQTDVHSHGRDIVHPRGETVYF